MATIPHYEQHAARLVEQYESPISLGLGAPDTERAMYEVSLQELSSLAQQFGLRVVRTTDSEDRLERADVSWTNVVPGLPDDGLGALPCCGT
jgi:hypothetical protein